MEKLTPITRKTIAAFNRQCKYLRIVATPGELNAVRELAFCTKQEDIYRIAVTPLTVAVLKGAARLSFNHPTHPLGMERSDTSTSPFMPRHNVIGHSIAKEAGDIFTFLTGLRVLLVDFEIDFQNAAPREAQRGNNTALYHPDGNSFRMFEGEIIANLFTFMLNGPDGPLKTKMVPDLLSDTPALYFDALHKADMGGDLNAALEKALVGRGVTSYQERDFALSLFLERYTLHRGMVNGRRRRKRSWGRFNIAPYPS